MLVFKTKEQAYQFCKENIDKLSQENKVEIQILEGSDESTHFTKEQSGYLKNHQEIFQLIQSLNDQKLSLVISELLINSLKNSQDYETLSEIKDVHLDKEQEIFYQIESSDDKKFHKVVVKDHFGSLKFADLIHLFSEKEVQARTSGKFGAGIGLRLVTQYLQFLKVKVHKNKETQVTAVVRKRKVNKDFFFSYQSIK